MTRRLGHVGGLAAWLALAGCVADPTAALVRIDGDQAVRLDTERLDLVVLDAERRGRFYHELPGDVVPWPVDLVLVPGPGDPDAPFRVIARAYDEAGALRSSRLLVGRYRAGRLVTYALSLDDACADVPCDDARDQTCDRGACVAAEAALPVAGEGQR